MHLESTSKFCGINEFFCDSANQRANSIVWTSKIWNKQTLTFYNLLHPISITVLVMFETSFSMFASSNHSR
jgi:hypothetical protein